MEDLGWRGCGLGIGDYRYPAITVPVAADYIAATPLFARIRLYPPDFRAAVCG